MFVGTLLYPKPVKAYLHDNFRRYREIRGDMRSENSCAGEEVGYTLKRISKLYTLEDISIFILCRVY